MMYLSQIYGGKQLQTDVEALKLSYQAAKVITDINKPDGITPYNVNELLASMKAVIDEQLGGVGAGSIDSRLTALRDDLQGKITAVNSKSIKDIVRVTGKVSAGTVTFDKDIAVAVPGIDTTKAYPLYYADTNKPVMALNGDQLKYDFLAGALVGAPAIADPADTNAADGVNYIAATGDINFKVFPVGTFTFETLPADSLIDNEELAAVSYEKAIQEIVVNLAQDQELIDAIKALVGTETVQSQIKLITDAIAARVTTLEGKVTTLEGDDTVEGSVRKLIKDAVAGEQSAREAADTLIQNALDAEIARAKSAEATTQAALAQEVTDRTAAVTAEKDRAEAAEAALQQSIANEEAARLAADAAIQNNVDALTATVEANRKAAVNSDADLAREIALINAVSDLIVDTVVVSNEQIEFTLPEEPNATKGVMKVNGIEYYEDADFTVDRVAKKVTWTNTAAANGFDLMTGWKVRFEFKKTAVVAPVVHI